MFVTNVTALLESSIVAVFWCIVSVTMEVKSDSILAIMNLEIVQAITGIRVKNQERLRANVHTLTKVDSSCSSTVASLTRRWTRAHDGKRILRSSSDRDMSKQIFQFNVICSFVNCFEQACLSSPSVQPHHLRYSKTPLYFFFFLFHWALISEVYSTITLRVSSWIRDSLSSGLAPDRTRGKNMELSVHFFKLLPQ